uniref:UDP-GlcNAc:betaGal beta-1,3-N-acetylglucosaminyltransferase like 1 n=1 Tax=Equus asinus TaxID=9793 RepID=A0A9L0JV65_EQUAS
MHLPCVRSRTRSHKNMCSAQKLKNTDLTLSEKCFPGTLPSVSPLLVSASSGHSRAVSPTGSDENSVLPRTRGGVCNSALRESALNTKWKIVFTSCQINSCWNALINLNRVFTSHGPTVVMPTWFCSRAWFSHVGPFDEGGQGVPEDLLFFYSHLRKGGGVVRVDQSLLIYRYHPKAATHSVLETTIWTHRVRFLEERALPHWAAFTIWNAGRQGRRLYRSLTAESRRKVVAFCDVDENKIKKGFYSYEDSEERPKPRVPILHFRAARPPFVICVKLDLTGGAFEDNLRSLHLQEGRDFLHFS